MLERSVRNIQKKIKAAGEDILSIQRDIGELLKKSIEPGDAGVIFRCRLLLNRCSAAAESLKKLYVKIPEKGSTAVTRSLCLQNIELAGMQKSTLTSLLRSMEQSENALDEAKRMELMSESLRIGERIRKNV